jgi:hypothetical protein
LDDFADRVEKRAHRIGADELLQERDVRKVVIAAEQQPPRLRSGQALRFLARQRGAQLDRQTRDGWWREDGDVDSNQW